MNKLRKPLSISLTSEQRKLLIEAPRSFNTHLVNFLIYLSAPVLIYLHTLSLSLFAHSMVIAAMVLVLHLNISKQTIV